MKIEYVAKKNDDHTLQVIHSFQALPLGRMTPNFWPPALQT